MMESYDIEKVMRSLAPPVRKYLSAEFDAGKLEDAEAVFAKLSKELAEVKDEEGLQKWIANSDEFGEALHEEMSIRYFCQSSDTQNEKFGSALHEIQSKHHPVWALRGNELEKQLIAHPAFSKLPKHYDRFVTHSRESLALFREENVPLQTEEANLCQDWNKLYAGLNAQFRGEKHNYSKLGKYLYSPDRELRESAYLTRENLIRGQKDPFDDYFDKLLALRGKIAENADCKDYREYVFKAKHREYTPAECEAMDDAIHKVVTPMLTEVWTARQSALGLDTLRPWDTSVDPYSTEPLNPFNEIGELKKGVREIFSRLDPQYPVWFDHMDELGLLDLETRTGKAGGAYSASLSERKLSFVFQNAVGVHKDVLTLLHECGHAFHHYEAFDNQPALYQSYTIEVAETASQSMELLGAAHFGVFYDEKGAARARFELFEDILRLIAWVGVVDSFQNWIYTNPGHTREERHDKFDELYRKFLPGVDFSEIEHHRRLFWHKQHHIFDVPFYYIEYAISYLGAISVFKRSQGNVESAIADYRKGLKLGRSKSIRDIYQTMGFPFDFGKENIARLMEEVQTVTRECRSVLEK
ncbi:MAG: M3 family oligoendopeptidase [Planctomycetes bacterium]|nr:M3 family oligoendopeptidase [Planctomycetota bacterium]